MKKSQMKVLITKLKKNYLLKAKLYFGVQNNKMLDISKSKGVMASGPCFIPTNLMFLIILNYKF